MSEPFIAEIRMLSFNFAPRGWAMCDGQLLPIAQNTALFSLIGTVFGGDGRTTFGLPDLRGRSAIHAGSGPGLSERRWGQKGGSENNTLSVGNLPSHSHALRAKAAEANTPDPTGNVLAVGGIARPNRTVDSYSSEAPDTDLADQALGNTGNGQAVNNMHPFLTLHYVIALTGIYPSQG